MTLARRPVLTAMFTVECALRNDKDGQKAIFSKALEADKKERDFKETHGLASLEKRYDKLVSLPTLVSLRLRLRR